MNNIEDRLPLSLGSQIDVKNWVVASIIGTAHVAKKPYDNVVYRAGRNLHRGINLQSHSVLSSHSTNAVPYIQTKSVRSQEFCSIGRIRDKVHKSRTERAKDSAAAGA
jgi:hypothetical protein